MRILKKYWQLGLSAILIVVILVLVLIGIITITSMKNTINEQQASMTTMESFIDTDVGPMVTCYVVTKAVRAGEEITSDSLEEISVPEKIAYTSEQVEVEVENTDENGNTTVTTELQDEKRLDFVTSIDFEKKKYFRVDMAKGTILMEQNMLDEKLDNTARYYQFTVDDFPTDIKEGDYVDIRIRFTYGEEFIALPRIKIVSIDLENSLFTAVLTEEQINTYSSMLLDKAMYESTQIYMIKYVDAGAQYAAEAYYPVNNNIREMIAANPNIINLISKEIQLERKKLNSMLGGDYETFDDQELNNVKRQISQISREFSSEKTSSIRNRLRAEEEARREAARNQ